MSQVPCHRSQVPGPGSQKTRAGSAKNRDSGQSVVEFALVLPVLLLLVLGMAQLSLIMRDAFLVRYAAYMTARTACVYGEEERAVRAQKAERMLKGMIAFSSAYGDGADSLKDGLLVFGRQWLTEKLDKKALEVEEIELECSVSSFVRVTVSYDMPLTVPVANRIFGVFQEGLTRRLFSAAYMPYYTLRASSIARVE